MRILFIIQGMQSGGAERVMSLLCNNLSDKGHEILLGLTERTDNIAYHLNDQVEILDLHCKRGSTISFFINSAKSIRKAIRTHTPDVVVSFITRANICTILGSIGTGVPVIVSERNNPKVDPPSKITRTIRRFVYPLANGFVFQTKYAKNCFSGYIQRKGIVIYNPIDERKLNVGHLEREKRVIAVGRLEHQKNFPMLINAFAKVHSLQPDYRLDIYGEGSLRNELQKLIDDKALHDAVCLKGHTDNTFKELAKSRIFVLTSDYEGMPNALMEAMCMGCACIATDAPAYGARELMQDGISGYLVPVRDENTLASKLLHLMENETLQRIMSSEARKIREKVKSEKIIDGWIQYICKTIK